jgi:IclR family acetate operon transcriptional repressor
MTSRAAASGEARPGRAAGALASGLDILELLAQDTEGLGVTAVARALGLDKGNTHRLLRMLEERGYVEQDPTTKGFRASVQLVALAGNLLRRMDLVSVARPVMRQLSHDTGEAVHLARRTRAGGRRSAPSRSSTRLRPGRRCTAWPPTRR